MLGILDAGHAEYSPETPSPLIALASCPVPDRSGGAPRLSGKQTIRIEPDAMVFRIYRRAEVQEEFFCNYELNPQFRERIEAGRLRVAGVGEAGEVRIVELPGHPFFVATLFLPQLSSAEVAPHPLITAYLEAILSFRDALQGS